MANTYTQIYVQFVFSVSKRSPLIPETIKNELEQYMCGIIKSIGCTPHAIYCNPDHLHVLIGINKALSISDTMKIVKSKSSKFINQKYPNTKFYWQTGYAAFSYSYSQIDDVNKYILNQKKHHQKRSYGEELIDFLKKYNLDFDEKYLFEID